MKKTGRVTAIMLVIAMVISLCIPAYALEVEDKNSADVVLTVSDGEISAAGDTVTIYVSASFESDSVKVNSIGLVVDYDEMQLKLTEMNTSDAETYDSYLFDYGSSTSDTETGKITYADANKSLSNSWVTAKGTNTLFSLTFEAKEGYLNGKCDIDLSIMGTTNSDEPDETNFAYEDNSEYKVVSVYFESGTITLTGGINPEDLYPTITTQPVGATYTYSSPAPEVTELSVAATEPTYGTLTYQWYSYTDDVSNAAAISGATSATYTPTLGDVGTTTYYYCEVTNTYHNKEYTATSDPAAITYAPAELTRITLTPSTFDYTGTQQTPTVTVTASTETLTEKNDYTLTGTTSATDANTYTITATGTGNYTGTLSADWTITPATITTEGTKEMTVYNNGNSFEISSDVLSASTEGNQEVAMTYTVTEGANLISVSSDGKVTGNENGDEGTAEITVEISAPNHATTTESITVTVQNKTDVRSSIVFNEVADAPDTYDGTAHELSDFVSEATYTGAASGTGTTTYELNGVEIDSLDSATITNAGTYTITAIYEDSQNYGEQTITIMISPKTIDVSAWTWDYTGPYEYSGTEQSVALSSSNTDIDKVTVTYSDNVYINADSYTATASLVSNNSNYTVNTDTLTLEWKIEKATIDVSGVAWTGDTTVTYDGNEHSVTLTGVPSGVDVSYSNNTGTNVGTYNATATLTATDSANYTLSGSTNWSTTLTINKAAALSANGTSSVLYSNTTAQTISASDIASQFSEDLGAVTITGVTTSNTSSILSSDATSTDSAVTYTLASGLTSAAAGNTATLTITFSSTNYADSTIEWTVKVIDKTDVSGQITFAYGSAVYTGEAQTYENATYTGTSSGTITYSYSPVEVKNVGTYEVTATYEDAENYGQAKATFEITPATLTVSGATVDTKPYDGEKDATVTAVEFDGLKGTDSLEINTDYTVSNAQFEDADAGENKTVTFDLAAVATSDVLKNYSLPTTGTGTGTIKAQTITVTEDDVAEIADQEFTGSELTPDVTVTVNGDTLKEGTDYTVSYSNNVNVGTATVTVSPAENGNYTFESVTKTFEITKATLSSMLSGTGSYYYIETGEKTIQISGVPSNAGNVTYTYTSMTDNNSILSGTPTVSNDGVVTITLAGRDAYADGLTATITVTVTMSNYETAEATVTVILNDKKTPTASVDATITTTYTGSAPDSSLISGTVTGDNGEVLSGTWEWVTDPATLTNAGTYSATVRFMPDDEQYATVETTVTLVVEKATPTGEPSYTAITRSGKTLADANLAVGTITPDGTITWDLDETTTVRAGTAYTWTFTPTDTTNYETLTGSIVLYRQSGGSSSGSGYDAWIYRVTVDDSITHGTVKVSDTRAEVGDTVTITVTPDDGYELDELTVTDVDGDTVRVKDKGDGVYSFTMPASRVYVDATFVKTAEEEAATATGTLIGQTITTPFTDISNSRFKNAIATVYAAGLMNGVSETTFDPEGTLTRAMVVTTLYRLAGSPDVTGEIGYSDVGSGLWYTDAVIWATQNGVVNGFPDGTFRPEEAVTREQLATIFYRYASENGYYVGNTFALDGFTDNANVQSYAVTAMEWAVANSVLVSRTTAMLNPGDAATRAEVAQALSTLLK